MTLLEIHDICGEFPFYASYKGANWLILGYVEGYTNDKFLYANIYNEFVAAPIEIDNDLNWDISDLHLKLNFDKVIG